MLALARRFFAAITTGDIDAVREIYAPGAVIRRNDRDVEQSVERDLRVLA
jgi:ketosteroid isomerase-like protein